MKDRGSSPEQGGHSLVADAGADPTKYRRFQSRLAATVVVRFERITGLKVVAAPLALSDGQKPVEYAPHPECVAVAESDYCHRAWQQGLENLARRPETEWHHCAFGKYCALLPVVWDRRCLAACQLVCPDHMTAEQFERQVELLDVLIENFLHREASLPAGSRRPDAPAAPAAPEPASPPASHPQVAAALRHIDRHLTDSTMAVAGIARTLGLNATYLAHLFSEQVGTRMSRYIADRRIELAKRLLSQTNWQIKRVAFESGHSSPYWFSEVFRAHTGLTPTKFRKTFSRR